MAGWSTCEVELDERVAGGRAGGSEEVDGLVGDSSAVGQVQPLQQGHVPEQQSQC